MEQYQASITTISGDHARASLGGELTIYQARSLRETLLHWIGEYASLEIDITQVSEIDTSAVQILMAARAQCERDGCELRLTGHSDVLLETADLLQIGWLKGSGHEQGIK